MDCAEDQGRAVVVGRTSSSRSVVEATWGQDSHTYHMVVVDGRTRWRNGHCSFVMVTSYCLVIS